MSRLVGYLLFGPKDKVYAGLPGSMGSKRDAVTVKDLSLVPSIHLMWLMVVCSSISGDPTSLASLGNCSHVPPPLLKEPHSGCNVPGLP